jgi:hypothetical protein
MRTSLFVVLALIGASGAADPNNQAAKAEPRAEPESVLK